VALLGPSHQQNNKYSCKPTIYFAFVFAPSLDSFPPFPCPLFFFTCTHMQSLASLFSLFPCICSISPHHHMMIACAIPWHIARSLPFPFKIHLHTATLLLRLSFSLISSPSLPFSTYPSLPQGGDVSRSVVYLLLELQDQLSKAGASRREASVVICVCCVVWLG